MAFSDLAPILDSLGITQVNVNNYFENKTPPPDDSVPPTVTKQKAIAIADAVFVVGIEDSGGIVGIARTVKLRPSQVKEILKELDVLYADWQSE